MFRFDYQSSLSNLSTSSWCQCFDAEFSLDLADRQRAAIFRFVGSTSRFDLDGPASSQRMMEGMRKTENNFTIFRFSLGTPEALYNFYIYVRERDFKYMYEKWENRRVEAEMCRIVKTIFWVFSNLCNWKKIVKIPLAVLSSVICPRQNHDTNWSADGAKLFLNRPKGSSLLRPNIPSSC